MRTQVRKMGNSSGVIIPKPLLAELGVSTGDDLDMALVEGRIVLAPVRRRPRQGWDEDSRRIAVAGDDALVWPEFGNDHDRDLAW